MTTQAMMLAFLADVRLPVGTHTQSAGLEPALQAGMPVDAVTEYVVTRLATVTEVEAATAVVARFTELARGELDPVERAWAARTPSRALRDNSRQLGRGQARLVDVLWPSAGGERCGRYSRAVLIGIAAARSGLGSFETASLIGYDDLQSVTSALLKLEPTDPVQVAAVTRDLLPEVDAMAERVAGLTRPEDIPAHAAPQLELWAEQHSHATERLFHA